MAESTFGESLESGFVGAFSRNQSSVAGKMFSRLFNFIKKFYNFILSMRFAKIMLQ